MSWTIGFDKDWNRYIGYAVPAFCDHPDCLEKIDRGLAYVCGGEPYGGQRGCGLYFCESHRKYGSGEYPLCTRCATRKTPFEPKPEHPDWIHWISTDDSWEQWRNENPNAIDLMTRLTREYVKTHSKPIAARQS